jgi:integrase
LDDKGGWRFLAVPEGSGRKPEWLSAAIKVAADGGRGFQFRYADSTGKIQWSDQLPTIEKALAASEGQPAATVAESRGLTLIEAEENPNRQTVRSLVDKFLARKEGKKSPATVGAYTFILNEFASQLPKGVNFIDQITADILELYFRWLQKRGAAPKTISNKLLVVCFLLKFAGVKNPSKLIEMPNVEDEPVIPYESDELRKIFEIATPEEFLIFNFFLSTGCREAEVSHAQWEDIDWKKSEYIVRPKQWVDRSGDAKVFTVKNHEHRRVPLTRDVVALLKARQKDSTSVWLFPNRDNQPQGHFLRTLKNIALRAGLNCGRCQTTRVVGIDENKKSVAVSCKTHPECEKHYLHRLRKTRATLWQENQVPIRTVQHWLGHKSLETTQKYLGVTDSGKLQEHINVPMY